MSRCLDCLRPADDGHNCRVTHGAYVQLPREAVRALADALDRLDRNATADDGEAMAAALEVADAAESIVDQASRQIRGAA